MSYDSTNTVLSSLNLPPPKKPSLPKSKASIILSKALPYMGLVFVFVLFFIISGGVLVSKASLGMILNQSVILMVVSVGAVFVYSLGGMDLSIGNAVGLAAIAGASVVSVFGSVHPLVVLLVCVVVGLVTGVLNSALSNLLNLPTFLASLATMSVCGSITSAIIQNIGTSGIRVRGGPWKAFSNFWIMLTAFLMVLVVCYIIFNYTKVGKYSRAIGSNRVCAEQSGVKIKKYITLAFVMSGFAIGVAAWLTIIRYNIVSDTTGSGLQMDVILAIVIGGMPVTGGARSRIGSAVVGALTLAFLSQGLTLAGVSPTHIQTVRGILFIVIMAISTFRNRFDVLPR